MTALSRQVLQTLIYPLPVLANVLLPELSEICEAIVCEE